MAQVTLPDITIKKVLETVFDFFIAAVSFAITLSIFTEPKGTLSENAMGIALAAAVGLGVWKIAAHHKLVDK